MNGRMMNLYLLDSQRRRGIAHGAVGHRLALTRLCVLQELQRRRAR